MFPTMKRISFASLALCLLALALPQTAPAAGRAGGPQFNEAMMKLFGDNKNFSAEIEGSSNDPQAQGMLMVGKLCVASGMARAEFTFAVAKGGDQTMIAQMKAMGMDRMVSIVRPDRKMTYLLYPGLNSYVEMPDQESAAQDAKKPGDSIKITEVGKETVDGHSCIKNKITITMDDGTTSDSLVWNATDLHNFPVRIQSTDGGVTMTMNFRNVSFNKPDSSLFELPAGFTRYENMQTMMQTEMMKRMNAMRGANGAGEE